MDEPILSVVAPCFNEQEVLPEFHRRMTAACQELGLPYELILVNDGSRDLTWPLLCELSQNDPSVVAVNLSRNHGHQAALSAGLSLCRGEYVLIIDADLQDPPELLPAMFDRAQKGVDVVYGQRRRRQGESIFKRISCSLFYRLLGTLSAVPIPPDTGDFRLISRRVLEVLLAMPEQHRFLRGMVSWVGYRQEPLFYDRDPRFAGESKYSLLKLWRLATDGIASCSTRPLHLAGHVGVLLLLVALMLLGKGLLAGFSDRLLLLGAMALLGGLQLIGLGILGAYVGRVHEQSKGRPLFLIDRIERQSGQPRRPRLDPGRVGTTMRV